MRARILSSLALMALALPDARASEGPPKRTFELLVRVTDENRVAVSEAQLVISSEHGPVLRCQTDMQGICRLEKLPAGSYQVRLEKKGFHPLVKPGIELNESVVLEVTLNHLQELDEAIDVVYTPPPVDPSETSSQTTLDAGEIMNLPYSTERDIRNILPFFPGVIQDSSGQVHLNGSESHQIQTQLDGFNISHPGSGLLQLRFSPEAVRSIRVLGGRYSAEYGKGSGGVIGFESGMGDDHFRFAATNFTPSFQNRKGVHLDTWTPRLTVSGPLIRGRLWFFEALDAEYNLDIIKELPVEEDRETVWRVNNLARLQLNLSPSHLLITSFLINSLDNENAGLSRFHPLETTRRLEDKAYLLSLKELAYTRMGLLETGVALQQLRSSERPLGSQPYVVEPHGTAGNFFRRSLQHSGRIQAFSQLTLPARHWAGSHELKFGLGVDRVWLKEQLERSGIRVIRADGTLSRESSFEDSPPFKIENWEVSLFVQDRWVPSDSLLFEFGLRLDRDTILRDLLLSPRLAATWRPASDRSTKLSAGLGVFRDATNLQMASRPHTGVRIDRFFAADGINPIGSPQEISFQVDQSQLEAPGSINWSVAFEHALTPRSSLEISFEQKRGTRGFTFHPTRRNDSPDSVILRLLNLRSDRYDAVQLTYRRHFASGATAFASYTRSAARSDAVFNFHTENLIFARQAMGPLPWDAPNRLISWGWFPLAQKLDLAYSLQWRDGFPFSVVNEIQQLVGPPNSHRFPDFFSLNLHLEKRFDLLGYRWGLRTGFNNLTGRPNADVVNNNIDSPEFLTFGSVQGRALVARLRLLGKK